MTEHWKAELQRRTSPTLQYLPGGEKCLFTVYYRRDRKLISKHIITPRKCFILSGYIKVTVLSPTPLDGADKATCPQAKNSCRSPVQL